MSRSLGQASHPTLPLFTQQRWVPGARIQGWIDMCGLRPCGSTVPGGKESAEHACMEEDYKQLPLPFTFTVSLKLCCLIQKASTLNIGDLDISFNTLKHAREFR